MRINLKANNIKNYAQQHLFISIYMLINVLEDPPVGVIEVEVKIPEYDFDVLFVINHFKSYLDFLIQGFHFHFLSHADLF